MIYNSVAEIFEDIDKTRSELKRWISDLNDEQKNTRASENGWTVAQIVEHLAAVENGAVRIAAKLLAKAEASGRVSASNGALNPPVSFIDRAKSIENEKLQAPEIVHPRNARSIEESFRKFDENRRALDEMRSRIEAVDSSNTAFPHPFFGNMNLYEWLALIPMHEARHLKQIEAILRENDSAQS